MDRTYFAETENWKHYYKIIFKCVTSAIGPIFNGKIAEKWSLWDSLTMHGCTVHCWKVKHMLLEKKKKKKGKKRKRGSANADPNGY